MRVCCLTATMSDVAQNGIEKVMAAAIPVCPLDDPWYTAVLYEAHLEHVDPEEPLWDVPYFGQTVRVGTPDEIFKVRQCVHINDSAREEKDLGFHAVIKMFGANKVEWRIVSSKSGRRSEMQVWADAEEKRLIFEHGGVLRDMDAKLKQTLNLTKGGKWGDPRTVWAAIDALRRRSLTKFQRAMETYVEEYESALVPRDFVDDDGYRLGTQLFSFRQGKMRKGLPEEAEINAWAEALPKWEWDGRQGDGYKHRIRQRAFLKFKTAMMVHVTKHESALVPNAFVDADGYALGDALKNFRHGQMRKGMSNEVEINAWAEALPKWSWNATRADDYRAKKVKSAKNQQASELRAELERARPIAVPFVKSKKRRVEMRAASTDFSGRKGNAVLYMLSEDNLTIRRVTKDGMMQTRTIVGLVVDPPPSDAFDSESD